MPKKTEQIAIHLDSETKQVLMHLAEIEGVSVSEYVYWMIEKDLNATISRLKVLLEWQKMKEN